jgi:Lrp/AsnC family transcriptional regulator, leucine-responsive regulatory protein
MAILDETDRRLLAMLQDDYRASYAELGEAVGLSVSGVNARLKRLTADGVLRGGSARVDPDAVGRSLCAFIQVTLERPEHDVPFVARMLELPAVMECHHTTGDFSYLLKVRVTGTAALEHLITHEIKALPGVVRSFTTIALSSPKETSALDIGPDLPQAR